jgi:hypothetical protein
MRIVRIFRHPGWSIVLFVLPLLASGWAAALAQTANEPAIIGTRTLLTLVLTTPTGGQPVSATGPCTKASDAVSLRDDIIYFLSKLTKAGSITSQCDQPGATVTCQLVIRQVVPDQEAVWSRTYLFTLDKTDLHTVAPVECYTIP